MNALVQKWKDAEGEKQRALIEREIRDALFACKTAPLGNETPGRVAALLGSSYSEVSNRSYLLSFGPAADPLWQRIDAGNMRRTTARKVAQRAKCFAGSLAAGVIAALAAYDKLPLVRVVSHGDEFFTRSKPSTGRPKKTRGTRPFRDELREVLRGHIGRLLGDLDPPDAAAMASEFEADLSVLLDGMTEKIRRRAKQPGLLVVRKQVVRRGVVNACALLVMNPPRKGASVDLGAAKKRMRARARVLHPDVHGGHEETRAAFEAVMDAYKTLETYNEQLKQETNHGAKQREERKEESQQRDAAAG